MTQNTISKVLVGTVAALAQTQGHLAQKLPTLPTATPAHTPALAPTDVLAPAHAPVSAPAPEPASGSQQASLLMTAPCLGSIAHCTPAKHPVHKKLVLPAPPALSRAKQVEGGLRMRGCPLADFNVPVVFGDAAGPQETINLLFDTGSGALAVVGEGAQEVVVDTVTETVSFAPITSPAFVNLPSTHPDGNKTSQSYGSGMWTGEVADNDVAIVGWPKVTMGTGEVKFERNMFAGHCDLDGHLPVQHDGILGMDTGSYNAADMGEYWALAQPSVKDSSFSLALCDINGTLVQGKPDAKYLASDFVYAKYQPGFYGHGIEVTGMRIGEQDLLYTNADFGQTLVDSGSTAVTLPAPMLYSIANAYATQTGVSAWRDIITNSGCFELPADTTRAELDASLPKITLQVADPDAHGKVNELTFGASNFLLMPLTTVDGKTQICSTVSAGQGALTILGSIANVGNWINFGHGVGFAKAKDTCEAL